MNNEAITVSELNQYIKGLIENDIKLKNIYVRGEISNFKYHTSGHMYFTLKDEESKVRCIMFRSYNAGLKFTPEDGMNVIIRGYISVYERDGQYQFYCYKMEPDGIGSLYLAYEQMKIRLENEGLFDEKHKKSLHLFPRRIGVATSATGAVIRDIINVSTKRFFNIDILLYPVKVQGEGAADSIISGIEYFNSREDIDVIIIGRGGGSIEELWAFNEEKLARAIYNSGIPVISAVGHETDFTIADFVSDVRASTPSQAAEIAVPVYDDLKYRLRNLQISLFSYFKNYITGSRHMVKNNEHMIERNSPLNIIAQRLQYIDNMQNRIIFSMQNELGGKKNNLLLLMSRLDDLSPLKTLGRGYAYVERDDAVVQRVGSLNMDDIIKLHMHDGVATCKVINKMEGELCQLRKRN